MKHSATLGSTTGSTMTKTECIGDDGCSSKADCTHVRADINFQLQHVLLGGEKAPAWWCWLSMCFMPWSLPPVADSGIRTACERCQHCSVWRVRLQHACVPLSERQRSIDHAVFCCIHQVHIMVDPAVALHSSSPGVGGPPCAC